ncbi:MAG: serine--tRNA ligase [Candidatus Aenigmarchaeota archaeon]|nr:serine--tRNA ligase [Candidatus Aenigmarchaeota archaeon]
MLDIKLIRDAHEIIEENLKRRNDPEKIELLHNLIKKDKEKRDIIQEVEALRRKRNEVTESISKAKASGQNVSSLLNEVKEIPQRIKEKEHALEELETECKDLLLRIPNLLDKSVPVGKDDHDNKEVKRWGGKEWGFQPKNHLELLENLNLIDAERAAKIAGHGFFYFKNELALLDMAVQRFALDMLRDRGFTIIDPPLMMQRHPYEGVVDIADFENVMYKIEGEDLYLIATSEHPMAAMFMNEILNKDDLPIKLAGVSPCFRKEVGAHGKYTKGLFRMHKFNKVEQFVFCMPNESWQIHEELQKNSEDLYEALEIPYRVVNVCTGDIGSIAAKKYDTEFLMADSEYREIGSNSNCTDYQARRLNVKYREKEGLAPAGFVHTLNNTALATSRTIVAILENHQNEDGTINVPKSLQPYTGFKRIGK